MARKWQKMTTTTTKEKKKGEEIKKKWVKGEESPHKTKQKKNLRRVGVAIEIHEIVLLWYWWRQNYRIPDWISVQQKKDKTLFLGVDTDFICIL